MRKETSTNFENQQILEMSCGLTYAVELLSGRWKVNILWNLEKGINRYGRMKKNISGISEKMLTQRLRDMENDGLIIRKDFKTIPPHVEYYLSNAGKQLVPVLHQLCMWGTNVREITRKN
ncbi:helix-turn-helix domain-containing protein [uncultured Aquimarina sp.]|uniref:winged helix-turn-helix transcriptional regulator n=1 Tax=uncultured Aquimarina sp. TaxID=575652 RepID=UPI00260BB739|nr:helix-turn-helix domain-containing protein [uncultured Aquimarina sp.]